jgi:hypothetical protein
MLGQHVRATFVGWNRRSRPCRKGAVFTELRQRQLGLRKGALGRVHNDLIEGLSPPGPPCTLSNLGISRFAPKSPELAGCAVGAVVSAETTSSVGEISAELSLALKSGCPATETVSSRDAVRMSDHHVLKPIEPPASPRNRCDQECTVLGSDRTEFLRYCGLRHENLTASGWWCLAPRHFDCVAALSLPL